MNIDKLTEIISLETSRYIATRSGLNEGQINEVAPLIMAALRPLARAGMRAIVKSGYKGAVQNLVKGNIKGAVKNAAQTAFNNMSKAEVGKEAEKEGDNAKNTQETNGTNQNSDNNSSSIFGNVQMPERTDQYTYSGGTNADSALSECRASKIALTESEMRDFVRSCVYEAVKISEDIIFNRNIND